jgi:hypothetical protein
MRLVRLLRTPPPPHAFSVSVEGVLYGRMGRDRQSLERVEVQPLAEDWFQLGPVGVLHVEKAQLEGAIDAVVKRLEKPPARASLVVPDTWVRSIVVDVDNLPRQRDEAEDVLRWKLKKLLPCRPEEVRLDWLRSGENGRVLVMLGLDRPLAVVEEAYAAAGVQVGRVEPTAVALTSLLPAESPAALLVTNERRTIGLVLVVGGKVTLIRHKTLPPEPSVSQAFGLRELERTLAHAREREGVTGVVNIWVASPLEVVTDFIADWSSRQQGVVMHRLALGAGRVPSLEGIEPVRLWSLLAAIWQGGA